MAKLKQVLIVIMTGLHECSGWKLEQLKQLENLSLSVIVYVLTFGKTESLNSAG